MVALDGHGPVIADVDFGCVHEHVTKGVPVCADCLGRHTGEQPLCCRSCELKGGHCCPVMLAVKVRPDAG
jgi:hypothetical protein